MVLIVAEAIFIARYRIPLISSYPSAVIESKDH